MPLLETPQDGPLAEVLAQEPGGDVRLHWLGQAGFVIDGGGRRVVIDPYLSDALAVKYRGTATPHDRMMPAPVAPGKIAHVDLILSTHAHTDHLDGETLRPLLAANPRAVLVAAAATLDTARARTGLDGARLIPADAGDRMEPVPGITLHVTRAAHETLEQDAAGRHLFLGYAIGLGGQTILHSGDTIPFDGQAAEIAALTPDLALLPVNGRDARRAGHGIAGNLTASEAMALAEAAGVPEVIAHHFGMFAFNTAAPRDLAALSAQAGSAKVRPARPGVTYLLRPDSPPEDQEAR